MKKGYILVEMVISTLIFSVLALLIFQLASTLMVKIKDSHGTLAKTPNLWMVQDLISRDLKSANLVQQIDGGFVANCGADDVSWRLVNSTLQRRRGKYNYASNVWTSSSAAVASNGVRKFEIARKGPGFLVSVVADRPISFFAKSRIALQLPDFVDKV